MQTPMKESGSIDPPVLPHFYFLLQAFLDQGPLALLEFSNSDILYLLKSAKIPSVDKNVSPEVKGILCFILLL